MEAIALAGNTTDFSAESVLGKLDERVTTALRGVENTEMWQDVVNPTADIRLVKAVMREISLEIFSYQPQVVSAVFTTIARMPVADVRMIKSMSLQEAEEGDHGEMALKDYVALGGDEAFARRWRMSVPAFCFASLWWGFARMDDPFAYLGAMYPFETLTPYVSEKVFQALSARGFPGEALGFVSYHAVEDIKHSNLLRHLIADAIQRYPNAAESILYGADAFFALYPIPVWNAAYERAKSSLEEIGFRSTLS